MKQENQAMKNFIDTIEKARKTALARAIKKWEDCHVLIDTIHTGHFKLDKEGKPKEILVPVHQKIYVDKNKKYPAEKLRKLRAEQLEKALTNHINTSDEPNKYVDGSFIDESRMVDSAAFCGA